MVEKDKEHFVYKRYYDEKSRNVFQQKRHNTTWDNIKNIEKPNEAYRKFLKIFSCIYEIFFPKKRTRVKLKNLMNPWVTKGIAKSSTKKQRLYEKCLKKRIPGNERTYKSYRRIFESIK